MRINGTIKFRLSINQVFIKRKIIKFVMCIMLYITQTNEKT